MGNHGATCAISGLPIGTGTPVRVMMLTKNPHGHTCGGGIGAHDMWVPRAFPLRAKLDEYLDADDFEAGDPDGIGRALWIKGLRYDCAGPAEIGADDSFDDLWSNLHQHGVTVVREARTTEEQERDKRYEGSAWRLEERKARAEKLLESGVPCARNVRDLIDSLPVIVKGHEGSRFVVQEYEHGDVRVSCAGYPGDHLGPLQELMNTDVLARFATVISASSRNGGYHAEIRVSPLPGTEDWHGVYPPLFAGDPLPVAIGYIRDDVWCAMTRETIQWDSGGWPGPMTFDQVHREVQRYYDIARAVLAERKAELAERTAYYSGPFIAEAATAEYKKREAEAAERMASNPELAALFDSLRAKAVEKYGEREPEPFNPEEYARERIERAREQCTWNEMHFEIRERFEADLKAANALYTSKGRTAAVVAHYLSSEKTDPAYCISPSHHFELWCELGLTGDAAAPWLRMFAEFIYVDQFMHAANRVYAPSNHGRDDGPIYSRFLRICADAYDADEHRDDIRYAHHNAKADDTTPTDSEE